MCNKNLFLASIIMVCSTASVLQAMVFDNRFIPLFQQPRFAIDGLEGLWNVEFFVATGSKAGDNDTEREIGIPMIFGPLDLRQYEKAFSLLGLPDPLPPQDPTRLFLVDNTGKIQAQGINFMLSVPLCEWLTTGLDTFIMRVNSSQFFNYTRCLESEEVKLDALRRSIFEQVGLVENHSDQAGFGDVDFYVRFGRAWRYRWKCKYADMGARFGVLVPTGVKRNFMNYASIPFGGNGHKGVYGALDGVFEVKEDIKVGLFLRLNKRFSRTFCERMSVGGEPYIYGATSGLVEVTPGHTIIFSPYFLCENLRKGLALGLQYHMVHHSKDSWVDAREKQCVAVNLCEAERYSSWSSEYFTIHALYDCGKESVCRFFDPIVSFRWDVPYGLTIQDRSASTYRVTLGIEFVF